jgi:hypothetical protein
LNVSNVKLLAPSDQTVLVKVNAMLRAPRGMSFSGKDVTLYLIAPSELKPGDRAVFFSNGWLYGENMAMRYVGQLPATEAEALKTKSVQVDAQTADDALLLRLRSADLVIQGKVFAAKVARQERRHRSEHETDWAVAEVQVTSLLKGQVSSGAKTVPVYFPTSTDEFWYFSPKSLPGRKEFF